MTIKPIFFDVSILEVLTEEKRECGVCSTHETKWVSIFDKTPMCSMCLLFKTQWGIDNKEDIYNFFLELKREEKERNGKVEKVDLAFTNKVFESIMFISNLRKVFVK